MSKKDEKWLQVGNFLLGVERNRIGRFVVCKSASGLWSVRWREDSPMFHAMLIGMRAAVGDAAAKKHLETVAFQYSYTTNHFLDRPFLEAYVEFVEEYKQKHNPLPDVTQEADEAALEEVVRMREVEEELEKLEEYEHD